MDLMSEKGVQQLENAAKDQRLQTVYLEKNVEPEMFIDAIVAGIDPLKKYRKNEFQEIVFEADEKAGELIWKNVWQDLWQDE